MLAMAWTALLVGPLLALCSSLEGATPMSQACAGGASDCGIGSSSDAALEPAFDEQPFIGEADGEVAYIDVSLLQHTAAHVSPKSARNTSEPSNEIEEFSTSSTIYRQIQVQQGICLTASNEGRNGAAVHLAWCDAAKNAQKWQYVSYAGTLKNWFGKCMQNAGWRHGAAMQGVEMRSCDGSYLQEWVFSDIEGFQPLMNSGDCLTAASSNQNLSPVYMKPCDIYRYDQAWSFIGNTWPHAFRGIRISIGMCLESSNNDLDEGMVYVAWCHDDRNRQTWKYDEGSRTLKNYYGKCLANTGYKLVEMRRCDGSSLQRWEFSNSDGYRPIKNSGLCLTADDIHENYMSSCDSNNEDQRWEFFHLGL